jgi:signal transduction histidine kinase
VLRRQAPLAGEKEGFGNGGTYGLVVTASVAESLSKRMEAGSLPAARGTGPPPSGSCLARLDAYLRERHGADAAAVSILDAARSRASRASTTAGGDEAADRLAASIYAGDALAGLAVEGMLTSRDAHEAAGILALVSPEGSLDASLLELYLRATGNPLLATLPPLFAAETVLRLLVLFGVVADASLWTRPEPSKLRCTISLGEEGPTRRERGAARRALVGSPLVGSLRRSLTQAVPVLRFGRPEAALVVRVVPALRNGAGSFLAEAAASLSPLLERALFLERGAEREEALVKGTERRLTRLGFDLHDGPIQDVLALAADARRLQDELAAHLSDEGRDHAARNLEDMAERLVELDRDLRELAHSLESRSAVSRPIEEVLHREVESFRSRSAIAATLQIEGTSAFLTASQRIALFRAAQEGLSNVREHSGAENVTVELRCARSWTELRVLDDGSGFEIEQGLASAAKRGRLGLIGISERVRMLGGTFTIDSAPGGPTRLTVSLPRWEPLDPSADA